MFDQLADIFSSIAFKYLSVVDADPVTSNQHEIGGLSRAGIGQYLGMPADGSQIKIKATLVYLDEFSSAPVIVEDTVTWYDCRYQDQSRGPEWRLYYKSNEVSERFQPGDFFLVAFAKDGNLLMIFCPPKSDFEGQVRTLFGARDKAANLTGLTKVSISSSVIAVPVKLMLTQIGIDIGSERQNYLDEILERFGESFPKTREFSEFSRGLVDEEFCLKATPDAALITWMDTEESAFRQLEKHIVQQKLREGFGENGDDVDEFVRFSLSVQNRRKSRSGHAFENHIEVILQGNDVNFNRGAKSEGRQKPDFLFPSTACYQDLSFSSEKLRILGAKTTCKDRWRQVLAEAARIDRKHLITMEPGISLAQTTQMEAMNLQLVVPAGIQSTYLPEQVHWLMSFADFIEEIKNI
ncbi:type II restriction endonuclease [Photobacterium indicum]|uniref:type II restriction endonuclease n=1 Tax=Photobacterium indicum TaxID=81447 RepID=UPI003D0E4B45